VSFVSGLYTADESSNDGLSMIAGITVAAGVLTVIIVVCFVIMLYVRKRRRTIEGDQSVIFSCATFCVAWCCSG